MMRWLRLGVLPLAIIFVAQTAFLGNATAQMFQCPPGSTDVGVGGPPGAYGCRCPDGSMAGIQGCPLATPPSPQAPAPPPSSLCPSPAQWVSGGGGYMCQCPNGQFLGVGQTCAPPAGDYCHNGATCPVGFRCSWMPGRCVPLGKVDCGDHYCEPGQQCTKNSGCMAAGSVDCGSYTCPAGNRCAVGRRACITPGETDCGAYACPAWQKCSSGGCIAQSAADCGNGTHCDNGRCSFNGKTCLTGDQIDCGSHVCGAGTQCGANGQCIPQNSVDCGHGHYCAAGQACGSDYQCMAHDATDCGKGQSCPGGKVCVNGGLECLTPSEIAKQRVIQQRLDQEAATQIKEDKSAGAWLKAEQARLAIEAEKKRVAEAEAARQQAAQAERLKQAEQSTTITTIRPRPNSQPTSPQAAQTQRPNEPSPAGSNPQQRSSAPTQTQTQRQLASQKPAEKETQASTQKESGQIARTMTASQFDEKYCPLATIMQYAGYAASAIANQRAVCAQQDLSGMPSIRGNCYRVQVMAGCGCYTVLQVTAEASALGCSGYTTAALTSLPPLSSPTAPGTASSNAATSSRAVEPTTTPVLSSTQIEFLRANAVSLTPPSALLTSSSPQNFNPQPVAPASFTVGAAGVADTNIWDRVQNGVSFANSSAVTDPNFKAGVQGDAITVGVGCAVGAAAGAGVGLGVGGIPGCLAGAAAATAIVGAATTGWQIGQSIVDVAQNRNAQGIRQAVETGVQFAADSPSKVGGIVSSVQIAGSWSTYFVYGFYNNLTGP